MNRTSNRRFAFCMGIVFLFGMIGEGCHARKCGCGADLMNAYKPSKKYR